MQCDTVAHARQTIGPVGSIAIFELFKSKCRRPVHSYDIEGINPICHESSHSLLLLELDSNWLV